VDSFSGDTADARRAAKPADRFSGDTADPPRAAKPGDLRA